MNGKTVAKKTKYYKRCIIELTNLLKMDKTSFCEDTKNAILAQAYFYCASTTAIFLATYAIKKNKLPIASDYDEIFNILSKNGKLDSENLASYAKMIEVRNILMFEYEQITDEMMYDLIIKNLPILITFLKDINKKG